MFGFQVRTLFTGSLPKTYIEYAVLDEAHQPPIATKVGIRERIARTRISAKALARYDALLTS